MADFQSLGAIAKGVSRGVKSGLSLAEILAERKLKEAKFEEEKRKSTIAENRFQAELFEDRRQRDVKDARRRVEELQESQEIERTRKLEKQAREREQAPVTLRDPFGNIIKEGIDPRDILQKGRKEAVKKPSTGEKALGKVAEKFLLEGVSRKSVPVANQVLKALGIDVSFEETPRGLGNLFGLVGPGAQKVVSAPQELSGQTNLPKATTPNQDVTEVEFQQFLAAAKDDINLARQLAEQSGFRVD